MKLERYCYALDLRDDPEAIESYKRRHRPGGPPLEVTRSLRDAGIAELDIYLVGNRLFMVMAVLPNYSPGAKAAADASNPHVQAWEALMGELQQELPFPKLDRTTAKWQTMEHIYSLAAQP